MNWTRKNEHYAQSDSGYRITIGENDGVLVHCAIAPAALGQKARRLIKCYHGADSKARALDACESHASQRL